jgi:hypothetical protein
LKSCTVRFGASLQLAGGWTYDMGDADPLRYGLVSTIKIRQARFNGCIDTMEMIASSSVAPRSRDRCHRAESGGGRGGGIAAERFDIPPAAGKPPFPAGAGRLQSSGFDSDPSAGRIRGSLFTRIQRLGNVAALPSRSVANWLSSIQY